MNGSLWIFLLSAAALAAPMRAGEPGAGQPQLGKLPLLFEGGAGLWPEPVRFATHSSAGVFLFEDAGRVRWQLPGGEDEIKVELPGARRESRPQGERLTPVKVHYLRGPDAKDWIRNLPTYERVEFPEVYPGIRLIYYGTHRQLEYDFVVAPGASPQQIRLRFSGMRNMRINAAGDLLLETPAGVFRHHRPRVYQLINGRKTAVTGTYLIAGSQEVGFEIGSYNTAESLIIDPVLSYSTYAGGAGQDAVRAMAVDASRCAYITGETWSPGLATGNAYRKNLGGDRDVFVMKLNDSGTAILYATYIGGAGQDVGRGIAVDSAGNAYVTGFTRSSDFPVTAGALRTAAAGQEDAFALKLSQDGSRLVYSTRLGDTGSDFGTAVAVNAFGEAYVAGYTSSLHFPATAGAAKGVFGGGFYDGFALKLNAFGASLVYSTYLGGAGNDTAAGIALDPAGNAHIAGQTDSPDFPTRNAAQNWKRGNDAFVTRLDGLGGLVYSTYLGGTGPDLGNAVAVDAAGNAYVAGTTGSWDFPATAAALQRRLAGAYDAFAAKLNPAGALVYASYLGGAGSDEATAIAVDSFGKAWIAGSSTSFDFPVRDAVQARAAGNGDAFVAALDANGMALAYSTYVGGSGQDAASALALDASGAAYAAGYTFSTDFPIAGGTRPAAPGNGDGFVLRLGGANLPPAVVSVSPSAGQGNDQTFRFEFSDPNGYSDLTLVQILINERLDGGRGCYLLYYRPANMLSLALDSGAGAYAAPLVKTAYRLENSQCAVDFAGSSVSGSANSLVLTLHVELKGSFAGKKNVYMLAGDAAGQGTWWTLMGSWDVLANSPPSFTVAPASGGGSRQRFRLVYSDPNGAEDLTMTQFLVHSRLDGGNGCYFLYDRASSSIFLALDSGAGAQGPAVPGSSGVLRNSQCALNLATSAAWSLGKDLYLDLDLSFMPAFAGPKKMYMWAGDRAGAAAGWSQVGTWSVQ